MAFEMGVDYGGVGGYSVGDCQLQVSSNQQNCDGGYHNLDLYTRNIVFDPRSSLVSYRDAGSCGPRGDDAVADTTGCNLGYRLVDR